MTSWPATYPTRSTYENALAERFRAELFTMLGPECGLCGTDLHGVAWELNHLFRRSWQPRKLSRYRRNKRYLQEAQQGWCNLLCPECNRTYRPKELPPKPSPAPPTDTVPW